jgi:hypothetical protein
MYIMLSILSVQRFTGLAIERIVSLQSKQNDSFALTMKFLSSIAATVAVLASTALASQSIQIRNV